VPASIFLVRLARPGGKQGTSLALLTLPFLAIALLAALSLALRFGAVRRCLVRRDDRAVHVRRLDARTAAAALVRWRRRPRSPAALQR